MFTTSGDAITVWRQLHADGVETPCFEQGLEGLEKLTTLALSSVGLQSLDGWPAMPQLAKLALADNKISGGLDALPKAGLPLLQALDLAGNKIARVADLEPLKELAALRKLDLMGCPCASARTYRAEVFALLPQLTVVDNKDAEGKDVCVSHLLSMLQGSRVAAVCVSRPSHRRPVHLPPPFLQGG